MSLIVFNVVVANVTCASQSKFANLLLPLRPPAFERTASVIETPPTFKTFISFLIPWFQLCASIKNVLKYKIKKIQIST